MNSDLKKLQDDILSGRDVGVAGREILRKTLSECLETDRPWQRILGFTKYRSAKERRDDALRAIWRLVRAHSKTGWAACESVEGGLVKFERETWPEYETFDSPPESWPDLWKYQFWIYYYNREHNIKIPKAESISRLMIKSNEYF